jgi:hypothetical protein
MMLEPLIEIAPTSGLRTKPTGSNTAGGDRQREAVVADAQARFWRVFRTVPRPMPIAVAMSRHDDNDIPPSGISR